MKRVAAILAIVFGVPIVQSALVRFLPTVFHPDLALLVVFALALSWRNTATGLVLAAICGFVVDLFSGALLGQHALLSVLAFVATRTISVHVSMIAALSMMIGALALTVLHAVGEVGLTALFTPGADFVLPRLSVLLPLFAMNALAAPAVHWMVSGLVSWVSGEDPGRRPLRLATRSWVP